MARSNIYIFGDFLGQIDGHSGRCHPNNNVPGKSTCHCQGRSKSIPEIRIGSDDDPVAKAKRTAPSLRIGHGRTNLEGLALALIFHWDGNGQPCDAKSSRRAFYFDRKRFDLRGQERNFALVGLRHQPRRPRLADFGTIFPKKLLEQPRSSESRNRTRRGQDICRSVCTDSPAPHRGESPFSRRCRLRRYTRLGRGTS